jgi:hypothetical protein
MKRTCLPLLLLAVATLTVQAQTTNYGQFSGQIGTYNSYFGWKAGFIVNGNHNSIVGSNALTMLGTASENAAIGSHTLYSNTYGNGNSAVGFKTLYSNTDGSINTAIGALSMYSNTQGLYNSGVGGYSLYANTTGNYNAALGTFSLYQNGRGSYNTATGAEAMYNNTDGFENTAVGRQALYKNVGGVQNVAVGAYAHYDFDGHYNTAIGVGSGPIKPGFMNCASLGYNTKNTASNQVRLGNSAVNSIGGYVNWSVVSDGRFKKDIKEDVSGLAFINKLRPVSYVLDRQAIDKFVGIPDSASQTSAAKMVPVRNTGFIAQEVDALVKKNGYVFSGIDAPQGDTDHYSIRYSEFVVPLVKAVQELTAMVQAQQDEIKLLKQQITKPGPASAGDINAISMAVLFQNNPNPFSADTEIKMSVPETTRQAQLIVYNMEGKQLKNFEVTDRGDTSVRIFANDLAAGIYLYALIVDGKVVDTKRLLLTK